MYGAKPVEESNSREHTTMMTWMYVLNGIMIVFAQQAIQAIDNMIVDVGHHRDDDGWMQVTTESWCSGISDASFLAFSPRSQQRNKVEVPFSHQSAGWRKAEA